MGATNFYTLASGTDSASAFQAVRDDAQYEYGHGGYTGTIAEKHGLVMLPALPARWTVRKVEDLISQAEYGESYTTASGQWKVRKGSVEKARAALAGWLNGSRWTVERLLDAYNDKVGRCPRGRGQRRGAQVVPRSPAVR